MQNAYTQRQFNPYHPKYFCCCGCHVMTAARIIAIIYSVYAGLAVLGLLLNGILWSNFVASIFSAAIGIACLACLWIGVLQERDGYLIPFIVHTILSTGGLVAVFVFAVFDIETFERFSNATGNKHGGHLSILFGLFLLVIGIGCLHVWSLLIVKKTYSYIQHKRFSSMYQSANVHQTQQTLVTGANEGVPPPSYKWYQAN
uniref:Uncharacterized protein n=1 Tax=Plectus sambesii TaxID=2011161 RepID=A0A914XBK6_9BILA